MNKYLFAAIPLIALLVLLPSGRGGAGKSDDAAPAVTVGDVEEENIEEDAYWRYTQDEDGVCLTITPEDTVYSFRFVGLHAEETEDGLQYVIDEELYSLDELSPDKPFLVKLKFVGLMPTYGVVYEDGSGNERSYAFNMKGTGPEESYPYFLEEIE